MTATPRWSLRIVWPFCLLVAVNVASAFYLNTYVLTDDVYGSLLHELGLPGQTSAALDFTRRWEVVGYVVTPLSLLARIGAKALLVQLALVLIGIRIPLSRLFTAATVAEFAILLGTVTHVIWLGTLPEAAVTTARLQALPGSLSGLLPAVAAKSRELAVLLERISVFDLGWMTLFTLALIERKRVSGAEAAASVTAVWTILTAVEWSVWLYLERLA